MMDSVFDTDMLGIKMELISYLAEQGFGWFSDFGDVDCCMTESSVTVDYKDQNIVKAVAAFAKANKLKVILHDVERGRITIGKKKK